MTPADIRALLDGATEGKRCQFHPTYFPEAIRVSMGDWDTSHEMSVILINGARYRLATYRHAGDAALSQAAPDLARLALEQAAALKLWRDAFETGRNEPLAIAYDATREKDSNK